MKHKKKCMEHKCLCPHCGTKDVADVRDTDECFRNHKFFVMMKCYKCNNQWQETFALEDIINPFEE